METVLTKKQAKKLTSYRVCKNEKDYQYRLDDGFCRLIRNGVDILKGKNAISCHSYRCGSYSYQSVDRFWHFMDGDIDVLKDKKALYFYLGKKRMVKFSDGGVWRSVKITAIKIKAVIFGIDGVLAEKSADRDYKEYDKVDLDIHIDSSTEILKYYIKSGYAIFFITGRTEHCREKTTTWILKHFPLCTFKDDNSGFSKLFMRRDTDHRLAEILKKEIYDNHIKDKYDVVAVFEDDTKICEMYKKEGLFVFQVLR